MDDTKVDIFISYSRADKPVARKLYRRLISDGFDAWLDDAKLLPGQDWNFEIEKALRKAVAVLLCLSSNSITHEGYVQKELKLALDVAKEKPEGVIYIIPVRLDECDIPNSLRKYHWVDLYDDEGYERIMQALKNRIADLEEKAFSNVSDETGTANSKPTQVTIIIEKDILTFTDREKESFVFAVSKLTGVSSNQIRILQVAEGSVIVTIELPEHGAKTLTDLFSKNDTRLNDLNIKGIFPAQVFDVFANINKRLGLNFSNYSLLMRALTHRSYVNENPDVVEDNERLEFLGNAALDFVVCAWVYNHFPEMQEGDLTHMRSALVRTDILAEFARTLYLGPALRLGHGELASGGRHSDNLLCATFEALIGALYLDAGLSAVGDFMEPLLTDASMEVVSQVELYDPKSTLQEWAQLQRLSVPHYRLLSSSESSNATLFEMAVEIAGVVKGRGTGRSKREAEHAAAQDALRRLEQ